MGRLEYLNLVAHITPLADESRRDAVFGTIASVGKKSSISTTIWNVVNVSVHVCFHVCVLVIENSMTSKYAYFFYFRDDGYMKKLGT